MMAGHSRYSYTLHTLRGQLDRLSLSGNDTKLLEVDDSKIYPTHSEIFAKLRPSITPNKVRGSYASVEEYLKIQYNLLREDFVSPLRDDLKSYEKYQCKGSLQNLHFHEVKMIHKGAKYESTCYLVEILSKLDQTITAPDSKRLINGAFVLFYYDDLRSVICGKVEDNENLRYKRLLVSLHPDTKMEFEKKYTMIEYTVFFEPYYGALKALRGMSDCTFPMQRYIVDLNLSVKRPSYLVARTVVVEPNLNPSQLNAMENALNKEFVLIQGPPGTGKTFLGLKIVKNLIVERNRDVPILVVTYKNHALDQFLEGLIDTTKDIIRLGGQSKNPKMAEFSIKNQRTRVEKRRSLNNELHGINSAVSSYYRRLADAENILKSLGGEIDMIATGEGVVKFSNLPVSDLSYTWNSMEKESTNIKWLLQNADKDDKLLDEVASLLSSFTKSGTWLFTMSSVRALCRKIDDVQEEKVKQPSDITERLRTISGGVKLQDIKQLLLKKVAKVKSYMSSDLLPLNIEQLSLDERANPFKIPIHKRWQLYKTWVKKYVHRLHERIDSVIVHYKEAYKDYDRASLPDNVSLMKKMKVIGMTTTCAARMRETLEMLQSPIVVIEEAAEVLEAHVVSSVTKHCKHLILIGDHQQLRPAVADYEIETKYNLGVSLFERMVTNGVECHTLDVQHRMRPEISRLIVPAIYPKLQDHESVTQYPNVRGIDGNVFFLDHEEPEANAGDCSKKNVHEAKFFIKLAEYLLMNGYKPDEITILSAYLGQVTALNREKRLSAYEEMKDVAIKSVDDYQGEENKIILLSLVRNNRESKIGFLSNEKRVCVALSRAREGLYIMGNMKHLSSKSQLWNQIEVSLKTDNAVGPIMRLKCQLHGRITTVNSARNFDMIEEGGCTEKCMKELRCGHVCRRMCHGLDVSHIAEYCCNVKCDRYPCPFHPRIRCNKLCGEECGLCMIPTDKELECGHLAKCYMLAYSEKDIRCDEIVEVELECCRHNLKIPCFLEADLDRECLDCEDVPKHNFHLKRSVMFSSFS